MSSFSGRHIYYHVATDGVALRIDPSFGGGSYELPNSIQLVDKPSIAEGDGRFDLAFHGKKGRFKEKDTTVVQHIWIPKQETMVFCAWGDSTSRLWRWSPQAGFTPISKSLKNLWLSSVSLDGKYALCSLAEAPNAVNLAYAIDGSEELKFPSFQDSSHEFLTMLNRNEFLLQVVIVNKGEIIKKWLRKENQLESLPISGHLSSIVVYNGALWGHHYQASQEPLYGNSDSGEIVRLNPDLKTIEQTIPLPSKLEHSEPRG